MKNPNNEKLSFILLNFEETVVFLKLKQKFE